MPVWLEEPLRPPPAPDVAYSCDRKGCNAWVSHVRGDELPPGWIAFQVAGTDTECAVCSWQHMAEVAADVEANLAVVDWPPGWSRVGG